MIGNSEAIASTGYVHEVVFLELAYVDEDGMTLVLWLDPAQLYSPIDEDVIREELGVSVPLDVRYGYFVDHVPASQATACPAGEGSSICYYWGRFVDRCLPTYTTSRCGTYAAVITGAGHPLPALTSTTTPPTPKPADSDGDGINDDVDQCDTQRETVNGYRDDDGCPDTPPAKNGTPTFKDDFENGFSKWTVSGQKEWQIGTNDDRVAIPGHTTSNLVAEADDCDDAACILSMASPMDLSGYGDAVLEFDRYVDRGLDRGEYLAVQVGNGGKYTQVLRWTDGSGDDGAWHREAVDLKDYLKQGFNVRFVTEQSSSSEDVGIDNVMISGNGAPVFTISDVVRANATDGFGALVSYNVSVSYAGDDDYPFSCNHLSGGLFEIGSTSVRCSAAHGLNNDTSTGDKFQVVVDYVPGQTRVLGKVPIYGGATHVMDVSYTANLADNPKDTITMPVTVNGTKGLIIAGHGPVPLLTIKNAEGYRVPTSMKDSIVYNGTKHFHSNQLGKVSLLNTTTTRTDSAFVPLTVSDGFAFHENVIRYQNGTTLEVVYGNVTGTGYREPIEIVGIKNNAQGHLLYKNATMTIGPLTFTDLAVGNYTSIQGDSGAPIIHHDGTDSFVIGMHKGDIECVNGLTKARINVGLGPYPAACPATEWSVFSAWEHVMEYHGLRG